MQCVYLLLAAQTEPFFSAARYALISSPHIGPSSPGGEDPQRCGLYRFCNHSRLFASSPVLTICFIVSPARSLVWSVLSSGTVDMLRETSGTPKYSTSGSFFESLPLTNSMLDLWRDSKMCRVLLLFKFCGDSPVMCCCVEFGNTCVTVPPSWQPTIGISDVTHAVSVVAVRRSHLVCLVWGNLFGVILAIEKNAGN